MSNREEKLHSKQAEDVREAYEYAIKTLEIGKGIDYLVEGLAKRLLHRAEVAERALVIMAKKVLEYAEKAKVTAMTSDGLFSCDKDAQLALLVNDALRKAEQLAEKEKEGKQGEWFLEESM